MKKLILLILIITTIMTSALKAQVTDPTFDPTWAAQFQQSIDDGIATGLLQGVSVALYVPGQGTFIGTGGESHSGVPITPDMQFCIDYSTQLFTSVILLKLQELGMLSLDDHLSEWLPSYQYIDGSATIRQLLSGETGFYDFQSDSPTLFDSIVLGPPINYTPEDILATIGPPHFAPGEAWRYSNTNYILAGLVIEAVTGNSYTANLHQYIFDPLNMTHTFLGVKEAPNGNVADGWYFGTNIGNVPLTAPVSMNWSSGAIYSTAKEMSVWYHNLYSGNIISQQSLDQLTDLDPATWLGLGIQFNYFPPLPFETPTYTPFTVGPPIGAGYHCVMGYDIRTGTVICELTNQDDFTNAYFNVLFPLLSTLYFNYPRKPDDAGIVNVTNPITNGCSQSITPDVVLKNFGSGNLTSVTINYQFDAGTIHTYNWSGSLATDVTAEISLPAITVATGTHQFNCYTSNPNGNTEGYTYNDGAQSGFAVNGSNANVLINEGFEGAQFPPAGWLNGQGTIYDWGKSKLSLLHGTGCIVKNNFDDATYRSYDIELPALNVSSLSHPVMSFNYAYAYWPGAYDTLVVMISTDCGATYQNLFYKGGDDLLTAPPTFDPFYPTDNQWKQANLDLSPYSGNVLIKFRDICQFSNLLYIDDVKIAEGCSTPSNLAVLKVTSTTAKVHWRYTGNANGFDIYYSAEGSGIWLSAHVTGSRRDILLSGLNASTTYEWYVTASCNLGTSPQSNLSSFTTKSLREEVDEEIYDINSSVFPNPASTTATIQVDLDEETDLRIIVSDVSGRILYDINAGKVGGTFTYPIDVTKFSSGVYFIEVKTEDEMLTQKLIVQ